jgi:hypothetical protein
MDGCGFILKLSDGREYPFGTFGGLIAAGRKAVSEITADRTLTAEIWTGDRERIVKTYRIMTQEEIYARLQRSEDQATEKGAGTPAH